MADAGDDDCLLLLVLLEVALLGELTALEDCLRLNTAAVMSNMICRYQCVCSESEKEEMRDDKRRYSSECLAV